jgi:predicted nucleic-acid-binding Zn-ribbon protein
MRSGTCPKCGGTEVYGARNGFSIGEYHRVSLRPHAEDGFRGVLVPHQTNDLWHYVCATCGLSETYLHDEAAVAFIRQRWVRVQPPG